MITATQIRAARALLRWSAEQLSERSGLSLPTIQRMERAEGIPSSYAKNLQAVRDTFEEAGVVFIDRDDSGGVGVRLRDRDRD
jgi:transcriptional regulator with XRE-family HTH domain